MTDELERLTHALTRPETAAAAAEALAGDCRPAAIEGLVELLGAEHSSRAGAAAVDALEACGGPLALDGLAAALDSPHAPVRLAAVAALHRRGAREADAALARLLRQDDSWTVRRGALRALADGPEEMRWHALEAATDPHWRVRHALIQVLLAWGQTEAQRQEIERRLAAPGEQPRVRGLRAYLRYRWSGRVPAPAEVPEPEDPGRTCPFWDWDEAVLARNLERLGEGGRRAALGVMPALAGHPAERVSALAVEALRHDGEARHLAEALNWLDDPRTGAGAAVQKLLGYLDQDRIEEVARLILHRPGASPAALAWALGQAGPVFPAEEEAPALLGHLARAAEQAAPVRRALAALAARWPQQGDTCLKALRGDPGPEVRLEVLRGTGPVPLERWLHDDSPAVRAEAVRLAAAGGALPREAGALADDPDWRVRAAVAECLAGRQDADGEALRARLRADRHPRVRAAALSREAAAELLRDLSRDSSWHVRFSAARLARVPLWEVAPERPWRPEPGPAPEVTPLSLTRPAPPRARPLGPGGPLVTPLGVSGHYGLPVEGFARAAEAGVNLFFWEPNYQTLTDFLARLGGRRNDLHLIAGTFEADGQRVRRDAERALRVTKVERLTLFLLFWVRSWARVTPDVREALERLKAEGKVAAFGLSTHSRPLAVEALGAGWGPLMVRHSAAHRGAEGHILPCAAELGTGLLTFNNTCYGRLLQAKGDAPAPRPADCYRYSLAQPGVTACLSAPATLEQLDENLRALRDPELPEDRRRLLLAQGERVYEEDTTFRKLVRAL
jgi:aryl-alcohol dehydrogenase-like predicted oxidoreductase/HEAT repeat protein